MKLLIYSDPHFCEFSSIIRSQGNKFSIRLENLIKSINWVENLAIEQICDRIVCLGDFFDRSDLNSREITALNEIKWSKLPHTYLVGNHDASSKDLIFNSLNSLKKFNFEIVDKIALKSIPNCELLLIPYILDSDRLTIKEYFKLYSKNIQAKKLVLSHNDIKGLRYGGFESKNGIEISDIENNCDLFLNGHLHNSSNKPFCRHGFNIGNLTGQNFNEDSLEYTHKVAILDTEKGSLKFIENPHAFNFYKLNYASDAQKEQFEGKLKKLKNNSVLYVKCDCDLKDELLVMLEQHDIKDKIIEIRIVYNQLKHALVDSSKSTKLERNEDHLDKFINFCREKITNNALLESELQEICR